MSKFEFSWQYADKLEPVFHFKGRYIILEGGRGSSKSHFWARKFLEDRLYKKRDLLCLREHQNNLKQSNYKLFKKLIYQYKLPFKIYSDFFVSETTGSEIVFQGMNNITEDNIKSFEDFADAWIEEGQNFAIPSFRLLDPTIRQEDSVIAISMNRKVTEGDLIDYITTTFPDNYLRIYICYFDNPFCPQSQIALAESVKKNNPEQYNEDWLGLPPDKTQNKVVRGWTSENEVNLRYCPDEDLHLSCDFNYSPNCWILAHKDTENAYLFDEFCHDIFTDELIRLVLDKYPHPGRIIINGDASGNNSNSRSKETDYSLIRNELIKRGYKPWNEENKYGKTFKFELREANGNRNKRFAAFNSRVKDNFGIPHIFADPRYCKRLIYNCKKLDVIPGTSNFALPTQKEIEKDPDLRFKGHAYDDASYLINTYWPITNDKYISPVKPDLPPNQNNFDHIYKRKNA